ncbi:hypothetical protein INR49_021858 [Caranx melampygus]|nr:hypothetical protein INR49_021858 [Caranx melampygus]
MEGEDDLDILTALLAESEGAGEDQDNQHQTDDLDGLFDDDNEEEEYKEGVEEEDMVSDLFGDVDDIENEEKATEGEASEKLNRSQEELQEELRQMQMQMQRLQQQLEASQKVSTPSSTPVRASGSSAGPKPVTPKPTPAQRLTSKPAAAAAQKTKTQTAAAASSSTPPRGGGGGVKLQESSDFSDQLSNADSLKSKPRVAHRAKSNPSPEDRGPLVEIKVGSSFQPVESSSKASNPLRSPPSWNSRPAVAASAGQQKPSAAAAPPPPPPKDVAVEKYSGLRLRKPRVSSSEMDRKMADRRLIRLSQVPERLAREKLEDSDWVTFAVLINKATPQSSSSGKTFSIWKLNDLHNLEVFVSLLLFGEVHKEHWKTEPGTVIGLLNPNPMKQKDGYDGVSLTVDHPQKVLLMGEAQDYGTCKAMKKNGEPCSQIVNMMKGKGGGLRERLCQDGFYYGGVSSAACAARCETATKPNKSTQKTLDKLFVKGSAQLVDQAKRLGEEYTHRNMFTFAALQSGEVSGCSNEFKSLMSVPTPGALQLKKHLTQSSHTVSKASTGAPVQSISASDLLKQQKQKQRELLESRRRRTNEIQQRVQQNSGRPGSSGLPGQGGLLSPRAASEAPKSNHSPTGPHTPTLGRGFSKDELSSNEGEEPAQKKMRDQLSYVQSEEFQKILNAKSRHGVVLQAAEYQMQERYFDVLVKKEQMEEKMKGIREMKCRAVTCRKCSYTYFKPADRCVDENHDLRWHDAVNVSSSVRVDREPSLWTDCHTNTAGVQRRRIMTMMMLFCFSNCGLFKWERDGMLKEKVGPKIGGELLQPRGEEHAKFLNSMNS